MTEEFLGRTDVSSADMLRRILVLVVALAACGDDGARRLADAPVVPDSEIDAPIDAPIVPPEDLELGITTSGNGTGRITSSPDGIDCGATCTGSFVDGTMVTLTAEPDASSVFTGWGGACSGTSPVCEVTITAATAVTATFTLKTYTVTVTKAGAGAGTVAGNGINCGTGAGCTTTVDHGTAISLTATPVSLNTFVGWGGACTGTGTCDLTITADTTISAAFALDELSLIVTRGGNGAGTITSSPAGINCPGTCDFVFTANQMVTLTAAAAGSSNFMGWSGACTGMGMCSVTMDAAKTVTATFTLKTYVLDVTKTGSTGTGTVTSSPAGIACGSDCSETLNHGTPVTLTATPTVGTSSFTGWSGGGCTGTGMCVVNLTAATTVNAVFTINSYPLTSSVTGMGTITSSPAGVTCPGDCSQNYTHGTVVSFTQMATSGWTFQNWGGACSGNTTCSVTMDQARNVTATFTLNSYDLTVDVTGMGTVTASPQISCGTNCTGTYTHNTVVSLTQMATTGWTFQSWGGACSGNTTCNVTMDGIKNVTALFTINSYALDANFGGTGGSGTITATGIICPGDCNENFNHGTVVNVTQTPAADTNFVNWSGACTGNTTCSVTMNGPRTVTANYALKQYNLDVTIAGSGTVTGPQIGCPTDCLGTYNHGTSVTLTQLAGSGYRFTGWSGGTCTGINACVVPMDMARAVTATFTPIFPLNVTIAGSTGTVTSNVAGINCPTDCSEDYLNTATVILTATGTNGATFGSWTGCPTVAGNTCTVAMSQARNVTATFNPPTFLLTAAFGGNGFGTITAAGIDCGNGTNGGTDCTETLVQGAMITLTAAPKIDLAAEASLFSGWSGCTSSSGVTCNVTMDAVKTVTATFALAPNVMFVTSGSTEILGVAWLRNANAICKNAAAQSTRGIQGEGPHQNTTWIPWISGFDSLSTPTPGALVTAANRLQNVAGWERVDRRPFLQKLSDIANNVIVYPPRIDENGADVGVNALTWTGTDPSGGHSESSCIGFNQGVASSWLNAQVNGTQGLASANSQEFTRFTENSCVGTRRLYCFGADRKAAITVTKKPGRQAFTTATPFIATSTGGPNNTGGLEAADKLCQDEAMAAGLPNFQAFKALLATTTASALSRFAVNPTDEPWVRVGDNQPLTATESAMRNGQLGTLIVAPNVTAAGQRLGNIEIWTGAPRPTDLGPNTSATCGNWKSPTTTKSSGGLGYDTGVSTYWFGAFNNVLDCAVGRRLVCMENLQ